MTNSTIGVDISKDHLDVHCLPSQRASRFKNNDEGFKSLIQWLETETFERIVFEASGPYHRAFERSMAKAFGAVLCKVNPKQARRFAEALGTHAKTDPIDAQMLARFGQVLHPKPGPLPSEILEQMRELLQARIALIKHRTATKNRLQQATLELLKCQAQSSLQHIEAQILAIDEQLKALCRQDHALQKRFQILTSIPGIGDKTAFILICNMPELGQLTASQAASLTGLAPFTRQSGKWQGKSQIRGGRRLVRQAIYMPALVAARSNPDLEVLYTRLVKAGKPAKVALTAVMRKLIVLANALLRDQRIWANNAP